MADLVGRSALITGAQQGIGAAIAIAFAREGADVAINYLDGLVEAETVAAAIRATGRRAVLIPADVSESLACISDGFPNRRFVRITA